ncbi:unnamed protein product [Prorocentrum cordatum]|uniref:Uncharacterized protein n=1 Tax=Prorocentrum cordatum TaxID=2364126 RepID=A0ABN9R5L5_9DINO|nr:unnamed protein product [Polarella glacialis]
MPCGSTRQGRIHKAAPPAWPGLPHVRRDLHPRRLHAGGTPPASPPCAASSASRSSSPRGRNSRAASAGTNRSSVGAAPSAFTDIGDIHGARPGLGGAVVHKAPPKARQVPEHRKAPPPYVAKAVEDAPWKAPPGRLGPPAGSPQPARRPSKAPPPVLPLPVLRPEEASGEHPRPIGRHELLMGRTRSPPPPGVVLPRTEPVSGQHVGRLRGEVWEDEDWQTWSWDRREDWGPAEDWGRGARGSAAGSSGW